MREWRIAEGKTLFLIFSLLPQMKVFASFKENTHSRKCKKYILYFFVLEQIFLANVFSPTR
jgi:hypothetical protein